MALPSGEEDTRGVATVESLSSSLARTVEEGGDLVGKVRILRTWAEDISNYCDPTRNPTAYRLCQSAAQKSLVPLLIVARDLWAHKQVKKDTTTEVRVAALEAVARLCFGDRENASTVAASGLLDSVIEAALRPVEQVQQQQEQLAAMQVVQAIAASAAEAPTLSMLLPKVIEVALATDDGAHKPFRSVRMTALEVLVSFSYVEKKRREVAALLPHDAADRLLTDNYGDSVKLREFSSSLLFANLSGLTVASLDGEEKRFDEIALPLWESSEFFTHIVACLDASLSWQPWPAGSNTYHRPWKLVDTVARLVHTGHAEKLRPVVALLIRCVEQRLPSDEHPIVSADVARVARLGVTALRGIAVTEDVIAELRQASRLLDALHEMKSEEPMAEEMLDILEGRRLAAQHTVVGEEQFITEARSPPF